MPLAAADRHNSEALPVLTDSQSRPASAEVGQAVRVKRSALQSGIHPLYLLRPCGHVLCICLLHVDLERPSESAPTHHRSPVGFIVWNPPPIHFPLIRKMEKKPFFIFGICTARFGATVSAGRRRKARTRFRYLAVPVQLTQGDSRTFLFISGASGRRLPHSLLHINLPRVVTARTGSALCVCRLTVKHRLQQQVTQISLVLAR